MNYTDLLFLGAIAGFTIFLGLPLVVLQNISLRKKGFLNALAIGILIFLIIDVFSHGWESAANVAAGAFAGRLPPSDAVLDLLAVFGGLAIGLLGLVWYETRYMMKERLPVSPKAAGSPSESLILERRNAYRFAMMIAIGIGAHNFSEGLAIGQSYASGAMGLAVLLIIGFGAHNTTEGFGIAGPLTGLAERPSISFLLKAGLIGGGPTFIGTVVGSLWISTQAYILFLSIAGGSLIYVSLLMYNLARRQATNDLLMLGIFVGLCAGFLTDLIVTLGGA